MESKLAKYFTFTLLALLVGCFDSAQSTSNDSQLSRNIQPASPGNSTQQAKLKWFTDYQEALNDARSKQRRILINFTGSDWCGWCIRLKREVFDTEDFKKYADEKLVLLEIDFPRRKQLPPSLQDANRKLMERFGVQGFPTLFLLNAEGKAIGQLGYTPGGPKAFISALESAEG